MGFLPPLTASVAAWLIGGNGMAEFALTRQE
jgi:hypothetical protein